MPCTFPGMFLDMIRQSRAREDRPFRFATATALLLLTLSAALSLVLQVALEQRCTTRLVLIWLLGIAFWLMVGPQVFRWGSEQKSTVRLSLLGIGLLGLNQILVYLAVPAFLFLLFGCHDAHNHWLINTLSNNLVANAICFGSFVVAARWPTTVGRTVNHPSPAATARATHITIKYGNVARPVPVQTIFLIEVEHNCISLFTENGKHVLYRSLSSFLQELPDSFVRVHRSRVVNKNHVQQIAHLPSGDAVITLKNSMEVRMSRTYKTYWR